MEEGWAGDDSEYDYLVNYRLHTKHNRSEFESAEIDGGTRELGLEVWVPSVWDTNLTLIVIKSEGTARIHYRYVVGQKNRTFAGSNLREQSVCRVSQSGTSKGKANARS